MVRRIAALLAILVIAALAACTAPIAMPTTAPTTGGEPTTAAEPTAAPSGAVTELVLVSHDSFNMSEEVLQEFEAANNAKVQILESGDAGSALNKAILAGASNPLGDIFFGVDNTFLSRALDADLFEPYQPANSAEIGDTYKLDAEWRLTPIDYGDVCLNYDKAWFAENNVAPPTSLDNLVKPEYKGLTAVMNPATSSPGLAFLLATVGTYGDEYIDFWTELRANDVAISEGWEDVYYNKSTWSGNGDRPIVVSYATSPAAEVFFSEGKLTEPPTGNVLGDGACFRQIEFAGIFRNAANPELAKKFIDFMVSTRFQDEIPEQMFVFPVNANATLPDFYQFAETPENPASVTAEEIEANRETWIREWTQAVLR